MAATSCLACSARLHHRNQQGLRADIEQLLDELDVARNRPHDRVRGIRRHRLQLSQDGPDIVGRVLAVDEQPIETGAGADFSAMGSARPSHNPICARSPLFSAALKVFVHSDHP